MKRAYFTNPPHPLHAIVLAFPVALFTGSIVSDAAYLKTAEIQWSNFSQWLIAGGAAMGVVALVIALFELLSGPRALRRRLIYPLLLLAMCLAAFINSFLHARDGWLSVTPAGLLLSVLTAFLALGAAWVRHSRSEFRA